MQHFNKVLTLVLGLAAFTGFSAQAQFDDDLEPGFAISYSGPTSCGGIVQFFSVGGNPQAQVNWDITFSTGGSFQGTGNGLTVTFPQGIGVASVTATKDTEVATLSVPYGDTAPAKPGVIEGHRRVCDRVRNYSISAVPGATQYTWTAESPYKIIHPVTEENVSSYTGPELDVFLRFPKSGSYTDVKLFVFASTGSGPCAASSPTRHKKIDFGPQNDFSLTGPDTIVRFENATYILSAQKITDLTWSLPSGLLYVSEPSENTVVVEAAGDAVGYVTANFLSCGESRSVSTFVRVIPETNIPRGGVASTLEVLP
ncbi:MAG TPA: hypothetical protein DCE41_10405, partial [Cytophagales bacterium]|nr:hypothetical protein [Cytophagales bacterium]